MAETLAAYITLGFSFAYCWAELVVYIYGMIINGANYWDALVLADDEEETGAFLAESALFEPSSASYLIRSDVNPSISPQYGRVALGSSAPISIDFKRQTMGDFPILSKSLVEKQVNETITGNHG